MQIGNAVGRGGSATGGLVGCGILVHDQRNNRWMGALRRAGDRQRAWKMPVVGRAHFQGMTQGNGL